jgi:hypothetical protein
MAKKKSNLKSICCNAKVRLEGIDDFDKQCTIYHICTYCNKPCDVLIKVRKTWTRNPSEQIIGDKRDKINKKVTKKEIEEIGCA